MLTLNQVKRTTITLHVKIGDFDGEAEMLPPTLAEYIAEETFVPEPVAPERIIDGARRLDTQDDDYRNARYEANMKRQALHVMLALIRAGNFPELKDKSWDEIIDIALKEVDRAFIGGVYMLINEHLRDNSRKVEQVKKSFRNGGGEAINTD